MKRFSNILFVVDSGTDDSAALNQALTLANNNQAQLTVVGVVEASEKEKAATDKKTKRLLDAMMRQRQDELAAFIAGSSRGALEVAVKVLVGTEFLEVIREVLRHKHDLVIKSAESIKGIAQLFGTTDMKLLRKCPCPVWVIKSNQQQSFREIVAALGYDPEDPHVDELNGQILEMSASLALADFAELHIIHAWSLPHESFFRSPRSGYSGEEVKSMEHDEESKRRNWLKALVDKHCAAPGKEVVDYLKPELHLTRGSASQLVPALAKKLGAELMVMGTVGRAGIPGFLVGNTAEDILHQIHCSVLTVKPHGFVTPVTVPE